ncbi:DUF6194 family protein [Geodermatophilus sp. Leaf369]|uniref:DUF6194 family protein n=1 Tax=Geodermatophilus sp. Leaf369 TaxID=1736354 RepID=UPI001910B6DA|nr:DUF6194 family protein [Geodermatophilus sp. Leaf369]
MGIEDLLATVRGFDGVVELAPQPGSDAPEIAWSDHFFYWAADGRVPQRGQPYATIITKDYPDDTRSQLDRPGRFRVNVQVPAAEFVELVGDVGDDRDHAEADRVLPHPVYAAQSWIAVVDPGPRTTPILLRLLEAAHDRAGLRGVRRGDVAGP